MGSQKYLEVVLRSFIFDLQSIKKKIQPVFRSINFRSLEVVIFKVWIIWIYIW